jgi:glutathione S-transferase
MHVYGFTVSPFVQRVLMAARAKGHEIDLRPPPGGAIQSDAFAAISPMGRIPLLEEDDGWRLCESTAIVDYLDDRLDGPKLLPEDLRERAHARQIASLALCELAAGLRPQMLAKVFRSAVPAELAEAGMAQAEKGMGAIEKVVDPGHRWAAGGAISIADTLLVPIFTLLKIIDPFAGTGRLVDQRPTLAAYYERAKQDPIATRTVTEMTDGFARLTAHLDARAEHAG